MAIVIKETNTKLHIFKHSFLFEYFGSRALGLENLQTMILCML